MCVCVCAEYFSFCRKRRLKENINENACDKTFSISTIKVWSVCARACGWLVIIASRYTINNIYKAIRCRFGISVADEGIIDFSSIE